MSNRPTKCKSRNVNPPENGKCTLGNPPTKIKRQTVNPPENWEMQNGGILRQKCKSTTGEPEANASGTAKREAAQRVAARQEHRAPEPGLRAMVL